MSAFPLSIAFLALSTSLGKRVFNSSSKAPIFWKIEVLGFFSLSPLTKACSTSTCLSFCIKG
uniref:Secreted protein n=1 Tax=Cannabis sativa TaxID=3483 RepID=A0A803QX79_CANSA